MGGLPCPLISCLPEYLYLCIHNWANQQKLSSVGELTDPPPSVSCRVKRPKLLNYLHFLILNLYNIIFIAIGGFLFRSNLLKVRSFFFSDDTDVSWMVAQAYF